MASELRTIADMLDKSVKNNNPFMALAALRDIMNLINKYEQLPIEITDVHEENEIRKYVEQFKPLIQAEA